MSHKSMTLTAILAVIAAAPFTVSAQAGSPADRVAALEAHANVLFQRTATWGEAAHQLELAAVLRGPDDARAVKDLMVAAGGYYYSRDRARARIAFVKAGESALALGDVEQAAHAFQRAALVAWEQKQTGVALGLKQRALRLAASPLLTAAQRGTIVRQFAVMQVAAEQR